MAVYQIMTDFLRLPSSAECQLEQVDYPEKALSKPKGATS
jgi:hypothetical protein